MALITGRIAAILACSVGIVLFTIAVTIKLSLVPKRNRICFSFRRTRSPTLPTIKEDEPGYDCRDIEQYGNLIIPPDRRPVPVAIDIMQHVLLSIGLPKHTKLTKPSERGISEQKSTGNLAIDMNTVAPKVSLDLPRKASLTPSGQVGQVMAEIEDEFEDVDLNYTAPVVDPMSHVFGSGRAMARLYR